MYTVHWPPGTDSTPTSRYWNWTAFILNNKATAHLSVPHLINRCCGAEHAKKFTLQMCHVGGYFYFYTLERRRPFSCDEGSCTSESRPTPSCPLCGGKNKGALDCGKKKMLSPRHYYIRKKKEACTSGKNDRPSDQKSTCQSPSHNTCGHGGDLGHCGLGASGPRLSLWSPWKPEPTPQIIYQRRSRTRRTNSGVNRRAGEEGREGSGVRQFDSNWL